LGLGVGLTTLHHKNKLVTKILTEPHSTTLENFILYYAYYSPPDYTCILESNDLEWMWGKAVGDDCKELAYLEFACRDYGNRKILRTSR
jgi:hypothetical protein